MRIECAYCLKVYDSDDSENEAAPCPFCASLPDRTTLREFRIAAPNRPPMLTSPFGLADSVPPAPPSPEAVPIVCPPANPSRDSWGRTAETPTYVKVPERPKDIEHREVAPPAFEPTDDDLEPDVEFDSTDEEVARRDDAIDDAVEELPRSGPTERPLVRSDRSPPPLPSARPRRAAVWVSFFLGAAGAAVVVKAWLPKIGEPDTDRESAGVAVAASLSMADDQESLGDLEQAATAVDRAVRAAPHDPLVLAARAKLAVERAEGAWLRRRATPAANRDASEDNDFVRLAADARGMAEDAFRALPNSDDARRTLVNALRIFGEVDRARDVARGLGDVTSAESMYALGAIDVAASKIGPETVQHLRESTWAGGVPGKGRAALAFALARTGDIAGARAELDKLALLARPHPAMTALRAIVDDADAQRAAKPPPAPKRNKAPKTCPDESRSKHRDTATILLDAAAARCRGDFEGARKLYLSVLDGAPEDSEALSGMGDVARQEDDWDTARTYYGRALRANPAFLPAALGAADVEWDVGSFAIAQRKYREILAASPDATLPPRVKERATIALPGSSNGAG